MRRISGSTVDVDEFGTGKDGYTSGDPQSGVPPTELSADCLDAIQEELAYIVETLTGPLDVDDNTQVATAICNTIQHPPSQGYDPNVDATAGSNNSTALKGTGNGTGAGATGVGGATDGSAGIDGTSSATNGYGVKGTAKGTGAGVWAKGSGGGGTGLLATAQAATDKALVANPYTTNAGGYAPINVGYQKAPTAANAGDLSLVIANVSSGAGPKLAISPDGSNWERYVPQCGHLVNSAHSYPLVPVTIASIPAKTLRTGSVIEVHAVARVHGGGAETYCHAEIGIYDTASTPTELLIFADTKTETYYSGTDQLVILHGSIIVSGEPGASVGAYGGGVGTHENYGGAVTEYPISATANLATDGALTVRFHFAGDEANSHYTIFSAHVKIT